MANSRTYIGPGTRWIEGDGTHKDFFDVTRNNADYIHEALNTVMDTDAASGVIQPKIVAYPASPWSVVVDAGVTWTNAFWQSTDTRWWWLWNTADASFVRGDSEFYIPFGNINDVPAS